MECQIKVQSKIINRIARGCWIKLIGFFSLCILMTVVSQCSVSSAGLQTLTRQSKPVAGRVSARKFKKIVRQLLAQPALESAIIGVHIEETESGRIIFSQNANTLLMPASNMKLFTTATGLTKLGGDYRYRTELYLDGQVKDGALVGNLIVKGSGDPTINKRYHNGDALKVFKDWADSLKVQGIYRIDGKIIGDDNIFDDIGWGPAWSWDYLWYNYAAPTGGLVFNDNCLDLVCSAGKAVGEPASLAVVPATEYFQFDNNLTTTTAGAGSEMDYYRYPGTEKFNFFGQIPLDADTIRDNIAVANPTAYFLTVFKETLNQCGISAGAIVDIDDSLVGNLNYGEMKLCATYQSLPLREIVFTINKISQNLYAEQLQKTIGLEHNSSTRQPDGIIIEREWLGSIGIDTNQIFIGDGSGLSRLNLVTPYQVVQLLKAMRVSPHWPDYLNSLPIGGVDGTLKNRFQGSGVVGHVFAKTGYIGRVRALSGYVDGQSGRQFIFSIIANHYAVPTREINNLQDTIIDLLYNLR